MPLDTQRVTIPFTVGQDNSEDPAVQSKGLIELRNGWYDSEGAIIPRPGFKGYVGETAADHYGLVVAGDSLARITPGAVRPVTLDAALPTASGLTANFDHIDHGAHYDGASVSAVDVAYISPRNVRYAVLAFTTRRENDNPGASSVSSVRWRVINLDTGAVVLEANAGDNTLQPRVVTTSDAAYVFFLSGTANPFTLKVTRISFAAAAPATTHTTFSVDTDVRLPALSPAAFDAVADTLSTGAEGVFVSYWVNSTTFLKVISITGTGVSTTQSIVDNTIAAASRGMSICVHRSTGTTYVVVAYGNGNIRGYTHSLSAASFGPHAVVSSVTAGLSISVIDGGSSLVLLVVGEYNPTAVASGGPYLTYWNGWTLGTGSLGADQHISNTLPMSRVFSYGTGKYAIVASSYASYLSGYRSSYVLSLYSTYSMTAAPIAIASFDEAALFPDIVEYRLPAVVATNRGYLVPSLGILEQDQATSATPDPLLYRARLVELVTQTSPLSYTQLQGVAYIAGSLVRAYDGTYVGEAAWLTAPEAIRIDASGGTGSTGTWSYKVVYEYTDRRGVVHVSPPSPAASTGAITNKAIKLTVDVRGYLQWFPAFGTGSNALRVRVFRTLSTGSTYRLAASLTLSNNSTSAQWTDTLTDADLGTGELLYSTAALESEPAPPLRCICSHRNRLVGIRADDPYVVAFTKELVDGITAPQWSTVLSFRVDDEGGPLYACASLGDKLVLFKRNRILIVTGYGPDANGVGPYSVPETVVVGYGCQDPAGVVSTPDGIVFLDRTDSDMTVCVLGGNLAVTALVQAPDVGTSYRTVRHLPSLGQTWVLGASSDTVAIYDHGFSRWYTWRGADEGPMYIIDVAEVGGQVHALLLDTGTATSFVATVTPEAYGDTLPNGTTFDTTMVVDTPWLRAADVGGMQRVRKSHVMVGGTDTSWTLNVETYMERDELSAADPSSPVSTHTFPASAVTSSLRRALRIRPAKQRCVGVRTRLEAVVPQNSNGPKLFAVSYDVGVLPKRGAVPRAARGTQS